MLNLHQVDGFSHPLRFIPVKGLGTPCGNSTESAASCANISQDHKGCCARTPAFSHIWAITTFTNSMKLMGVDQVADVPIAFPDRQFYAQPIRLFHFYSLFVNR